MNYLSKTNFALISLLIIYQAIFANDKDKAHLNPPPSIYENVLKKQLNTIEDALKIKDQMKLEEDKNEFSLIKEVHYYIEDNGKSYSLFHYADMPLSKTGIGWHTKSTYGYSQEREKIYFIEAETIYPDGTRKKVEPKSIVIKTPQHREGMELYSDQAEMVIIFPDVKEGAIVRSLVLKEEHTQAIKNHFMSNFSFNRYAHTAIIHRSLNIPNTYYNKLTQKKIGLVPEVQEKSFSNRKRLEWKFEKLLKREWEVKMPPLNNTGPLIKLTTLKDWNEFCDWYRGLTKDRSELPKKLIQKILSDCKSKTKEEKISYILNIVSNDIRYTGLEFGIAGWQPKKCEETWNKKFGDCKDKSLLMCALLKVLDIKAHLALISTNYDGLIHKETPNYASFNHAIVAIENKDDFIFCDPTIEFAQAGVLSPSCRFREALVIKEKTHVFKTTSEKAAGPFNITFDLNLQNNGDLEGTITIDSFEYWYSTQKAYYGQRRKVDQKDAALNLIKSFFETATLYDISIKEFNKPRRHQLKAYFQTNTSIANDQNKRLLFMNDGHFILQDFKNLKKRNTPYPLITEDIDIKFNYSIPDQWTITKTPAPLKVDNECFQYHCSWTSSGNTLNGFFGAKIKKTKITPLEYTSIYNSNHATKNWLAQKIIVEHNPLQKNHTSDRAQENALSLNMPIMPSPEGQLDYIERNFPGHKDLDKREAALNRLIQYFPKEHEVVFEAMIKIASLKMDRGVDEKEKEAIKIIDSSLAKYENNIDKALYNWALYMRANALENLKEFTKAKETFKNLAIDANHSEFRRGWSYFRYLDLIKDEIDTNPFETYKEALSFESEASPSLIKKQLEILLKQKKKINNLKEIKSFIEKFPKQKAKVLSSILYLGRDNLSIKTKLNAIQIKKLLIELGILENEDTKLKKRYTKFNNNLSELDSQEVIKTAIRSFLKKNKNGSWNKLEIQKQDKASLEAQIDKHIDNDEILEICEATMQFILLFDHEPDEFFRRTWHLPQYIEDTSFEEEHLEELLKIAYLIPKSSRYHKEVLFTNGKYLRRKEKYEEAIACFTKALNESKGNHTYAIPSHGHLGLVYEKLQNYDKALEHYKQCETSHSSNNRAYHYLLRAAIINLNQEKYKEALRIINIYSEANEDDLKDEDRTLSYNQINQLMKLAEDPEHAIVFWKYHQTWWSEWNKIANLLKIKRDHKKIIIPIIDDPYYFVEDLEELELKGNEETIAEEIHRLAESARWFPDHMVSYLDLDSLLISIKPEQNKFFREHIIKICNTVPFTEKENIDAAITTKVANLIDGGWNDKAIDACTEFFDEHNDDSDNTYQVIARLHLLAASSTKTNIDETIEINKNLLDKYSLGNMRGFTVFWLGKILYENKKIEEATTLLKEEVSKEVIKNSEYFNNVNSLLKSIEHDVSEGKILTKAIQQWLNKHSPPWYNFAKPKSIDNFSFKNIERIINNTSGNYIDQEIIKTRILVASSVRYDLEHRIDALTDALFTLYDYESEFEKAQQLFFDFTNNKSLNDRTRRMFLWYTIYQAYKERRPKFIEIYNKHPLTKGFNKNQKRILKQYRKLSKNDLTTANKAFQWLQNIEDDFIDDITYREYLKLFDIALGQRKYDLCKEIINHLAESDLDSTVKESKLDIKLRLTRTLSSHKSLDPIYNHLLTSIKKEFFDSYQKDKIKNYNLHGLSSGKDFKSAFNTQLYRLFNGYIIPGDDLFFQDLPKFTPSKEASDKLKKIYLSLPKLKLKDDLIALRSLQPTLYYLDEIKKDEATQLLNDLKHYENFIKYPVCKSFISFLNIAIKEKANIEFNFDTEIDMIQHPQFVGMIPYIQMYYYYTTNQKSLLEMAINRNSSESLSSESTIATTLKSLKLLNKPDEYDIFKEFAERYIYQNILRSWAQLNQRNSFRVFYLTDIIKAKPNYPKEWFIHIQAQAKNELSLKYQLCWDALVHQKWEKVKSISGKLVDSGEKDIAVWFLAKSYFELGETQKSKEYLKKYIKTSELKGYINEARQLLQKINNNTLQTKK